ncbi:MAG: sigma-54-dependent Fis family transcriptional regulator [Aquificota bacterium]|nr:MAG: sigma-54-dependent Fis family transcriptional regulator [Aquificota bacterium]RLD97846.1 MAG: sigma-54-dependent Fis family transcriptional regulator [Aquificota bacterium]RLD99018.1 MAG: sigma-54-dependent Fis family transcriptional regulator [Aquificota bacterium]
MGNLVLIVDDEKSIRESLRGILEDEGYRVAEAASGKEALEIFSKDAVDLVLLDIWLPEMDGVDVLKEMKEKNPLVPIIMISGHGTIETAVKTIKLGAYDFVEKPLNLDELIIKTERALREYHLRLENLRLREKLEEERILIGESPPMKALRDQIKLVAPTDGWVLITGESGTGKELVAREIHALSIRKDYPFVEVSCAAIPEDMIEKELFGWEGNTESPPHRGKFELAHRGTLFLDEVGDMSLKVQAKVLRVIQELSLQRIGGRETIPVDIRIIASTNKNLEEEIEKGLFREDLYFRLNVIPIHVPPLRERREDIPLLVDHFLKHFSKKYGMKPKTISPEALSLLMGYHWPGNVRELRNMVERLVIMVPKEEIGVRDLPHPISETQVQPPSTLREAREAFEKEYILRHLEQFGWNISRTAEYLGIERSHLYKKLKAYGIEPEKRRKENGV